ncbi:UNKNOWN [Stylonychia lemnae]|uniref:HD domain-containing protein n=1 Tax=Stylonychia lemnae TaxID=5949 RepID=A0A078B1F9_STYLE|nr:UNKNOWN [Stylonychia lemnae]|eukprot:CDW87177.1 UNKNOWN [Stylonychia lemnae]
MENLILTFDTKKLELQSDNSLIFETTFPKLDEIIKNSFAELSKLKEIQQFCSDSKNSKKQRNKMFYEHEENVKTNIYPAINKEISIYIPEWSELMEVNNGHVNCHTLNVIYCISQDKEYQALDNFNQNVLKWAGLLHDLKKLSYPFIEGKDHMHPFKSGKACLEIFQRLGLIVIRNQVDYQEFTRLLELIDQSKQPVPYWMSRKFEKDKIYCTEMHSHDYLSDIFTILWNLFAPRGSFVDLVFRLVFFHQSLCGIKEIPPMIQLNTEQQLIYCDVVFLKLIKILMKNDSLSYMYVYDYEGCKDQYMQEFEESNTSTLEEWLKKQVLLEAKYKCCCQQN